LRCVRGHEGAIKYNERDKAKLKECGISQSEGEKEGKGYRGEKMSVHLFGADANSVDKVVEQHHGEPCTPMIPATRSIE
tara:strand:+ start:242 stop:478 length:237 start_codon:yes stop_codon:yes gene_type:complete